MQKITVLGNLGRDPEDRRTSNGKRIISFSIAVKVKKDVTQWYDINIWEDKIPMFEGILKHIKKGSQLLIIGDLGTVDTYVAKDGSTKVKLKIQPLSLNFVGSSQEKKDAPASESKYGEYQPPQQGQFQTIAQQEGSFSSNAANDSNEEVPF